MFRRKSKRFDHPDFLSQFYSIYVHTYYIWTMVLHVTELCVCNLTFILLSLLNVYVCFSTILPPPLRPYRITSTMFSQLKEFCAFPPSLPPLIKEIRAFIFLLLKKLRFLAPPPYPIHLKAEMFVTLIFMNKTKHSEVQ